MNRQLYSLSSVHHYFLVYDCPVTAKKDALNVINQIDSLPPDETVIAHQENPSPSKEAFVEWLDKSLSYGFAYDGRCSEVSYHVADTSFYSKKTAIGWVGISFYDLGTFTGKPYYVGKFGVSIGVKGPREEALEVVEEWVLRGSCTYGCRTPAGYFRALWDGLLVDCFDVSIERYLATDTIISKSTMPLTPWKELDMDDVIVKETNSFIVLKFVPPAYSDMPDLNTYEAVCEKTGFLSTRKIYE